MFGEGFDDPGLAGGAGKLLLNQYSVQNGARLANRGNKGSADLGSLAIN